MGHSYRVYSVAFSPDGKYLASGSRDNSVKIWSVKEGKELYTLEGHNDDVLSIAFSNEQNILASGSTRGDIIIWNFESQ